MRADRPSLTAAAVAFARGVGLGGRRDELAREVLPRPFARALDVIRRVPEPVAGVAARLGTLGLVDHASLRMLAVDAALEDALQPDVDQVVLLGAGLDTRAWRMAKLAGTTVFEVDHPATQAYKRERMSGLSPRAREVRFVPLDFERGALGEALGGAGHATGRPTVWLWEAVTMYLAREAVEATLAEIAARSAPGSTLLLTYVTPELTGAPFVSPFARAVFRAFGEPLVGTMRPEVVHALLRRAGFEPASDTSSADWSVRFGSSAWLARFFADERLVVAPSTRR